MQSHVQCFAGNSNKYYYIIMNMNLLFKKEPQFVNFLGEDFGQMTDTILCVHGATLSENIKKYCLLFSKAYGIVSTGSGIPAETAFTQLSSRPEVATWNASGSCTVICDAGGEMHFVHSNGTVLFSQRLMKPQPDSSGPMFCGISFVDSEYV
jgi:hypothetical protein